MKIIINIAIVILLSNLVSAQNQFPDFSFSNIALEVSNSIPGIIKGEDNNESSFNYSVTGQVYSAEGVSGHIQTLAEGFNGTTNRETPWETLTELLAAYQNNNFEAVKNCYTNSSKTTITNLFNSELELNEFMSWASQIEGIELEVTYEFKGGIYALAQIPNAGIQPFYFELENGQYKLAYLEDDSDMNWNIALYCKFKPQPMLRPEAVGIPDQIYIGQPNDMLFKLNEAGNYLTLFISTEENGKYVVYTINDGGQYDEDSQTNKEVEFDLDGDVLPAGEIDLLFIETNYPVELVSNEMIDKAGKLTLSVVSP